MKFTIDRLTAGDLAAAAWAPAAVIAATGVRAAAIWAQAILTQGLGLKVVRDLQNDMFAALTRGDLRRATQEESGRLVSRFTNDINVISEGLIRAAQAVLRDALTILGALASMFWFDWALALYVIAVFLVAGPLLSSVAKRARSRTEAAQAQLGGLTAILGESLAHPRFVRAYRLEEREIARAGAAFEERRRLALKLVRNRAITDPFLEILGGLALAGVLFIAGVRIASGAMTVGDLLGIVTAVGVASPAARALGGFNTVMNEALAALARVFSVVDAADQVTEAPHAQPLRVERGQIAFQNVSFAYGEAPALTDVSFTVAPGEMVALVGPSGAGKSTVFNLLPRFYDPQQGRIEIDGQDIRAATLASVRDAMALVSQDAALFDDTVRANIAFGRADATQKQIEAAAQAAAAHAFIAALPGGYDARVGERGGSLSGGERQRIALARAFLRDAPILLLDEATSALDAESEAHIQGSLRALARGRTTLVIAHRLATVREAQRILVFDGGRIVEQGDHATLVGQGGLYARLCRLQFDL
ncbi:MAG: ATP-binding cassette domain-containing protein [Alphaproteobacteria bacterium]|nr:ATP-binding cassette domain-containing protein [Alphaproteobacteria bacterium]